VSQSIAEVCVVGLGPAGLGASLSLAESSIAKRVVCIEAGVGADLKTCSILEGKGCRFVQPCQIVTGVGGSSLLSGGKISLFPAGRAMTSILGSEDLAKVRLLRAFELFSEYVKLLAPDVKPDTIQQCSASFKDKGFQFRYYDSYRYRLADLVEGYEKMLAAIRASGVSINLETEVEDIERIANGFRISTNSHGNKSELLAKRIILAIGRAGKELIGKLDASLHLDGRPRDCDVGVRLEFPTALWPDIDECHKDLKLHFLNARTFCVCKDGLLAPYRLDDIFLLEGHADPDVKTGFTNLAITIRPPGVSGEQALGEVRKRLLVMSNGKPIRQSLLDFLNKEEHRNDAEKHKSSISYWQWGSIRDCFPENIYAEIYEAVAYFASRLLPTEFQRKVSLYAPEMDYYWPEFPLNKGFVSNDSSVYIIGDSAGQFRGILQAFCSGLESAHHILN
jgi:uncharacterized FAD-dependent dehydrogenase